MKPADLFAELWEVLDEKLPEARELDSDPGRSLQLVGLVAEAKGLLEADNSVAKLKKWADGTNLLRKVAAAQAIDAWYEPLALEDLGAELDEARGSAKLYYRENCRLNENSKLGLVILRRPLWGRWVERLTPPPAGALELCDLFDTLVRLPAAIDSTDPDEGDKKRKVRFADRPTPGRSRRAPGKSASRRLPRPKRICRSRPRSSSAIRPTTSGSSRSKTVSPS
jgi:hypothetical protein